MTLFSFAIKNISRDKRTYIYYFVNCVFSVFVFFFFSGLSFHPAMSIIDERTTLSLVLMFGEIISIVFSICFISYSIRCFLKTRNKQLGPITLMGASKKQLNKLIFTENMLIGFTSILVGILFGIIFSKLFLIIASKVIGVSEFVFYFPIKAIILTAVVIAIVFLLIAYFTPKTIRKKEIIRLIKSEEAGEKRQRLLPTTAIFVILSIISIWIFNIKSSFTEALINSQLALIPLIITIVLGTYLLFAYSLRLIIFTNNKMGSPLKLLYRGDMRSKLKASSQSMTVTAILYAISFFAIIVLLSVSSNVKMETQKILPYAMTYDVRSNTVDVPKDLERIEKELNHLSGYSRLDFSYFYNEDTSDRNGILSVSKYNEIMRFLGRETISVKKGNAYLVSGNAGVTVNKIPSQLESLFTKNNLSLEVIGSSNETIMLSGLTDTICVISDENFELLESGLSEKKIYAFNYDNWETDSDSPQRVKTALGFNVESNNFYIVSAYNYYNLSKIQNNLTLYIGGILCFTFILAMASFMYSRLYSAIDTANEIVAGKYGITFNSDDFSYSVGKQISEEQFVSLKSDMKSKDGYKKRGLCLFSLLFNFIFFYSMVCLKQNQLLIIMLK